MNKTKELQWFSALLVFLLDSAKDPNFRKAMRSLVVFRAEDFEKAHEAAIETGKARAIDESIHDRLGVPELRLTFCYVETLDIVGKEIDSAEVWCQLSTNLKGVRCKPSRSPSQTI